MKEIKNIFEELNKLYHLNIDNDLIANKARKLFERALKIKMEIPLDQQISLKKEWQEYYNRYRPEGVKYSGEKIIDQLNQYSHDTTTKPTDEEIKQILTKLNSILEIVLSVKNGKIPYLKNSENKIGALNENQQNAVSSTARITLVNAGPGTGKTHLIVYRIIKKGMEHPDKKIIGLSFTNQAAITLKQRVEFEIFGTENFSIAKNIHIGTIHSFALKMFQDYYDEILHKKFEYDVIDELELKEIKNEFNKNQSLIKEYLEENKLLTFNEILSKFQTKLNEHSFINYITENIQEFVIDEAQDLDKKQYEILKKLFEHSNNIGLFLVGDPRQNIYGFTGGSIENLFEVFKTEQINRKNLTVSYRCPQKVLDLVNSFKFMDEDNIKLINPQFSGEKPILFELSNKNGEALKILEIIQEIKENNLGLYKDIAILAPSSFYFEEIAKLLNKNEIPYKIFGGETLMKREIRFLLNVIKTIKLNNTHALKKSLAFLDRDIKIKGTKFQDVLKNIDEQKEQQPKNVKKLIDFIQDHLIIQDKALKIIEQFIIYGMEHGLFSTSVADEYVLLLSKLEALEKYDINEISIALSPNNNDFSIFYSKAADFAYKKEITDNNYVTLSTIHSAKGKEWDHVIIPGMSQDIFPKYKADDLNAELKKFYVACTRTIKRLYLTRPKEITYKNERGEWTFDKDLSIFLKDMDHHLLDIGF